MTWALLKNDRRMRDGTPTPWWYNQLQGSLRSLQVLLPAGEGTAALPAGSGRHGWLQSEAELRLLLSRYLPELLLRAWLTERGIRLSNGGRGGGITSPSLQQ